MIQLRDVLFGFFTGVLLGLGFWIFIDGAVSSQDAFPIVHIVPAVMVLLSAVMTNAVDPNNMNNNHVKMWLFLWFTASCVSVGIAIWITAVEYPPDENWPGVTIIIMTVLVFSAGLLFFVSRKKN